MIDFVPTKNIVCEVYSQYFGPCNVMNPFIDELLHDYKHDLSELKTQSENLDDKLRCRLPIHLARVKFFFISVC